MIPIYIPFNQVVIITPKTIQLDLYNLVETTRGLYLCEGKISFATSGISFMGEEINEEEL